MAARAAERPSGKVSEVFSEDRERQGAYDLLESGRVEASVLMRAMGGAAARLASSMPFAYVAVDGASVTLTDRGRTKDLAGGKSRSRGVEVINPWHAGGFSVVVLGGRLTREQAPAECSKNT